MKGHLALLTGLASLAAGGVFLPAKQPLASPKLTVEVASALKTPCGGCHSGSSPSGGVNPFVFKTEADALKNKGMYERMIRAVRAGAMPPASAAPLSAADRKKLIDMIEAALAAGHSPIAKPTIRRLNKSEYTYTVEDLLGVRFDVKDEFPNDDVGEGFDNIGDVLTISPLLMEMYINSAEKIAAKAIVLPGTVNVRTDGDQFSQDLGSMRTGGSRELIFFANGEGSTNFEVPYSWQYRMRILAGGDQAGPDACKMSVKIDGKLVQSVDVAAPSGKPIIYEFPVDFEAGTQRVTIGFTNDYYKPDDPNPRNRDRNLVVSYVEVDGPIGMPSTLPPQHLRLIPAKPTPEAEPEALRRYLGAFASRAYRRPAKPAEIDRIVKVARLALDSKETFERAMQVGVTAVLCSPNFLFRPELDGNAKGKRPLTSYELASSLSYFLWSSMPDDALLKLAAEDKLKDPAVLAAQAERMRKDPKSNRLGMTFAAQWLELRLLETMSADKDIFPEYSDQLKKDLVTEATTFFDDIVRNDRSVLDFIDSPNSFVNERLAKHYGIDGITGNSFRKVALPPGQRGGLLGMGSVLMLTSNPNRTSPTKRGKWVLEQMLGAGPPPPPPNVGVLAESTPNKPVNMREQLELHRKSPNCAPCHAQIDPIGFALENYSPTGAWRTQDQAGPVDTSGVLPDGTKVNGPTQLREVLMARKNEFVAALASKMMTFALGRGVTPADNKAIQAIVSSASSKDYRMSVIIEGIVTSDAFRFRESTP